MTLIKSTVPTATGEDPWQDAFSWRGRIITLWSAPFGTLSGGLRGDRPGGHMRTTKNKIMYHRRGDSLQGVLLSARVAPLLHVWKLVRPNKGVSACLGFTKHKHYAETLLPWNWGQFSLVGIRHDWLLVTKTTRTVRCSTEPPIGVCFRQTAIEKLNKETQRTHFDLT